MKRLLPFLLLISTALAAQDISPIAVEDTTLITDIEMSGWTSGSFVHSGSAVLFEGIATSPLSANATITVNGKRFTATRDLTSGQASWSGEGTTLMPEDQAALLAFDSALVVGWMDPASKAGRRLPGHKDLVTRLAMLLAEAPLGVPMTAQQVPRPAARTTDRRYTPNGTPHVESCLADAIATTEPSSSDRQSALAECQQSNEDGILYFGSCDTHNRTICHDADSHCFICEQINSGPWSPDCLGRCGPGCGLTATHAGIYTYDCGDHDRCGRVHGGSLNPWDSECGDEYFEADDDFLWGRFNCT